MKTHYSTAFGYKFILGIQSNRLSFIAILFFIFTLSLSACGTSSVTTVGNPSTPSTGAQIDITISNDLVSTSTTASNLTSYVTISSGSTCGGSGQACYTPDMYILGIRNIALIECQDSSGTDINCPGQTGKEVNEVLAVGESFTTYSLTTSVVDYTIYASQDAPATPAVGDDSTITTNTITQAALYSGLQFGLDFIITQYPTSEADIAPGSAGNGNDFVMYCLNQGGCSGLTGYSIIYDGLADGDVQSGDLVFLDAGTETWFFFDTDSSSFIAISNGRPTNMLTQGSVSGHPTGSANEVQYNASFGSSLTALNITQALIDAGTTDELTIVYSVENTMSFTDKDSDQILDADEITSLAFGKFSTTEFGLTDGSF